jgi:hypothetical protein
MNEITKITAIKLVMMTKLIRDYGKMSYLELDPEKKKAIEELIEMIELEIEKTEERLIEELTEIGEINEPAGVIRIRDDFVVVETKSKKIRIDV